MPPRATKNTTKSRQAIAPRQAIVLPADDAALVREDVVLQVWPVGPTTLQNQIKAGEFPRPVRIGKRMRAWTVGSIRKKLAEAADDDAA
jgi:predicted DNA-binding transcriptional regulator AlpA